MGDPTRFVDGYRAGFGPEPPVARAAIERGWLDAPRAGCRAYTRPMTWSTGRNREADAGTPLALAVLDSSLGPVHVAASADGIHGLELRTTPDAFAASVARRTGRSTQPIAEAYRATRAMVHRLEVELA